VAYILPRGLAVKGSYHRDMPFDRPVGGISKINIKYVMSPNSATKMDLGYPGQGQDIYVSCINFPILVSRMGLVSLLLLLRR
jgi:hypothetical protein